MRKDMRGHIAQHMYIQPMLRPLTEFVHEKAHEIMAMQLDPKYCKGNMLFKLMLGTQEEARELMKEYDDKSPPPALRNLDLYAKVGELPASYYGEATFSAVAADLLKPSGEDWLASRVLEGEVKGEASRIQGEAVESMLEHELVINPNTIY
eukprot:jgi/Tetstr1/423543/TSEL_014216.t1